MAIIGTTLTSHKKFTQMKTNLSLLRAAFLTGSLVVGLFACQKEKSEASLTPQEEEQAVTIASESEAEAEVTNNAVFDDAMGANDEVGMSGTGIFGGRISGTSSMDSLPRCATVTITHSNPLEKFPIRIVTDFGTAGCLGKDGHKRYGKIITEYTGRLIVPGKSAVTVFDGYRVGDIKISGTFKITNTSTSNMRQFTIDVQNAKRLRPNGDYVQWNSHRVITQVEGLGTPEFPFDDVFTITGYASGTVKRGDLIINYESTITEPLRKRFNCRWISKGEVKTIRRSTASSSPWIGVLNYGNGECDNAATLTINGVTRSITLP